MMVKCKNHKNTRRVDGVATFIKVYKNGYKKGFKKVNYRFSTGAYWAFLNWILWNVEFDWFGVERELYTVALVLV